MSRDRADLGFSDALDDLDLREFTPRQAPTPRRPSGETSRAAEAAGFRSREPKTANSSPDEAGEGAPALQRRRRTGRNAQFNLKARPETIAAYCTLADQMGWGLGETLEKAVELLEERYGR
jgi:hypothetical protein